MSIAQSRLGGRLSLEGLFKRLGPGVITGAADDDPSGIATYSQAGAQGGFNLLWTVVLTAASRATWCWCFRAPS
jgi:Mn2+/Fe2+ NRAMP family transporter